MSTPAAEHLRMVVWPRPSDEPEGRRVYRYVLVGMLITDQPIEGLHPNQTLIDGAAFGLSDLLANARQVKDGEKLKLGDATSALLMLPDVNSMLRLLHEHPHIGTQPQEKAGD